MPGLPQISSGTISDKNKDSDYTFCNALTGNGSSVCANGFWSRHSDNVSYDQLQKFWCELTPQARRNLLRIDKNTLFEHARKNMYCSRCNGLLLEGFFQIVMYGKSQQPNPAGGPYSLESSGNHTIRELFGPYNCQDDVQDPAIHPWGGLTTTRDGILTLLDCYFFSKSLRDLQNLFDSARARERERELLYPDACGGGGRGWMSQGSGGYGRGHGSRESCALHTAKLSVETLVDFWSALGEETHQSLLRMKEDDFIERLMYRFDSKRFCRDCRKNVIREFKELKELGRTRRETRCTSWFCVADTAFEYEVSHDTVQVDWYQTFSDTFGKYHHFEWAVGTGDGKSDILEFENVGLKRRVQAKGLDLSGLNSCHITVRAWKVDGRCDELCAKAHALQGQQCVHCRLVVGGGFVTITTGESITRLFEHAEEAEEEEDDEFMDKDGNDLDGECFRPQKHAKSPELAREFLLDAATIIFKEQVEKAFREGTARQNAHSILICLALKLLEERAHIACKEIITLEKQTKLLEEEEKEKQEKEERKEQRRTKEREKKLRRKERLKGRENREKKSPALEAPDDSKDETKECFHEVIESPREDLSNETGEVVPRSSPSLIIDASDYSVSNVENASEDNPEGENGSLDWSASLQLDDVQYPHSRPNVYRNSSQDLNMKSAYRRKDESVSESKAFFAKYGADATRCNNGLNKQVRGIAPKPYTRISSGKNERFQYTNRSGNRYDPHSCSCNQHREYRPRPDHSTRVGHDPRCPDRPDTSSDLSKSYYRGSKYLQLEFRHENSGQAKSKMINCNSFIAKKVWEPLDPSKKFMSSHSDSDITSRSAPKVEAFESSSTSSDDAVDVSVRTRRTANSMEDLASPKPENCINTGSDFHSEDIHEGFPKEGLSDNVVTSSTHGTSSDMSIGGSSNSDNCSSCLSEGGSITSSSPQNMEPESTSDSEDSGRLSNTRPLECCVETQSIPSGVDHEVQPTSRAHEPERQQGPFDLSCDSYSQNGREDTRSLYQTQSVFPQMPKQTVELPFFGPPPMDYYHQGPGSWSSYLPTGLQPFPVSSSYLFPSTRGYGFGGNAQFMLYQPLQHPAPPVFNHPHMPIFQPVTPQANDVNASARKLLDKATSIKLHPATVQPAGDAGQNVEDKAEEESNGFSLFHFGGPVVSLSAGTETDPAAHVEGKRGPSSSVADCHSCGEEKDSFQHHKLLDGKNGVRFSIF